MSEADSAAIGTPGPLERQMVRECEAMARHALSPGLRVPGAIVEVVEAASAGGGRAGVFERRRQGKAGRRGEAVIGGRSPPLLPDRDAETR